MSGKDDGNVEHVAPLVDDEEHDVGWKDDGNVEDIAHLVVFFSFLLGVILWIAAPHTFRAAPLWLALMGVVAIGMRVGGRADRLRLAELLKEATKRMGTEQDELELIEQCRLRGKRRAAIRAGQTEDDGLSDFGRACAQDPEMDKNLREYEEKFGRRLGSRQENIFELEQQDKKIEAAWKRKLSAESAWRNLLAKL